MNLLAFDTSTEAMSVALVRTGAAPLAHSGEGGAKASSTLIPAVLDLLARAGIGLAALDAIAFGCGPGSFTGLRTACSVAQGLALGAGVPVLPVETLLAVAEAARERTGAADVLALLDARMDEVYAARYWHDGQRWQRQGEIRLCAPDVLEPAPCIAGNAFGPYGGRLPAGGERVEALPTAAALLRLAPQLLAQGLARPAEQALPLYVRDKVAQTTAEREAARAAAAAAARMAP
ncbi:tRNA (adenosine(37)-N6)-threonylcarbamoyltransferase complex dimerization subunit type 1 TsaB [Ramlibacter tataouinensis]|uniref:tRNA (adenosine(37)-N6)-threonylcarbamoyltransferase complex dimerization subunit type 1 TsaB n=1 Tax=Ramlibacter tataouinensis TaxID=94132 RepID=UPI0022F3D33A|nr:tRNA (adenosine(37)-N6)-threonylcarbamoyltransferase complex dimerization subunit type 1 TsaB [Ramlibacter tataouinensis]WBY00159.1 tRNA (adenosine(37)-N6)-threonylcarbamoyltransferase complex dimerization subunit type 1 TsaB [Ramlibacter tataouinensis]